jgi:HSP20 family molecular chaperone IbpA
MIPIPFSIDVQNATAVFKDRVLKVMLPRLTAEYPARIRIPIKP